ncbi:MAG: polymer-forming cytoskeletal protein [Elusimicrobiota bacterium]
MNKTLVSRSWILILCALALSLPATAGARRNRKLSREAVHVPAGETRNRDIATKGPVVVDGTVNADVVVFGSSVTVRGEVNGDVVALGGDSSVSGQVRGDLVAIGGDIELDGTVTGDAVALGGRLTLLSSAAVYGEVAVLGGKIERAEGATVKGDVTNLKLGLVGLIPTVAEKLKTLERTSWSDDDESDDEPIRHHRRERSAVGSAVGFAFFLFALAGLGGILTLVTLLAGEPVERVAEAIKTDFWRSAGFGLLVAVGFVPALVFLAVSIIGIPVIPLAFLALFVAVLMSLAGFSRVLAQRLYAGLKRPMPSGPLSVAAGFALLNALFIVGRFLIVPGGLFAMIGLVFILTNLMLISAGILLGLGATVTTRLGTVKCVPSAPAAEPASGEIVSG